jgi:hypothetical protein
MVKEVKGLQVRKRLQLLRLWFVSCCCCAAKLTAVQAQGGQRALGVRVGAAALVLLLGMVPVLLLAAGVCWLLFVWCCS